MYPIALHLQGKKCIVFGAGKVAQRRVWGLLESGAEVTVAAPEPMPACWKNAKLTYLQQPYAPELLGKTCWCLLQLMTVQKMPALYGKLRLPENWHRRQLYRRTARRTLLFRHIGNTATLPWQ